MFSKFNFRRFHKNIFVLSLYTLTLSCTPKVGEQMPAPVEKPFTATACVGEATASIKKFAAGTALDAEVSDAWSCIATALRAFHKYVRGENRDSYEPQEIATFLEDNFFSDISGQSNKGVLSKPLQAEFMKVKQVLIGGSREIITRDEIIKLVEVFGPLEQITLKLNPYMKIYNQSWKPAEEVRRLGVQDDQEFEKANEVFKTVAVEVAALLSTEHEPYRLDDITSFFEQMGNFYGEKWPFVETLKKFMPVGQKVKKAIAGGAEDAINPGEWKATLLLGGRAYIQYLRYNYFLAPVEEGPEQEKIKLAYFARTVEDVFSIFEDLVREKPSRQVTLSEFDEIGFSLAQAWPQFKYSEKLGQEFLRIKQVFFGGQLNSIAQNDFETARLKVSKLKSIYEIFVPYYGVYEGTWNEELNRQQKLEKFERARQTLDQTSRELGALFESSYDLNKLSEFAAEWGRLYGRDPVKNSNDKTILEKFVPVLVEIKNMLFASKGSEIKKNQWSDFLGSMSRAYSLSLFYDYFLKNEKGETLESLDSTSRLIDQGFKLFSDILNQRPRNQLPLNELLSLLKELQKAEVLSEQIDLKNLEDLLKVALGRIFNPPLRRLAGERPEALKVESLEYARKEIKIWLKTQIFLTQFVGRDRVVPQVLRAEIRRLIKDENTDPDLMSGLRDLNVVLSTTVPFVYDSQDRLLISTAVTRNYDLSSLSKHNLVRFLSRLFVRSYVTERSRLTNYRGLNAVEAERAFRELKPIAIDMGLIGREDTSFMTSRFREANLFMPSSDGNKMASFSEIHELVAVILSGIRLAQNMKRDLIRECAGGNSKVTRVSYVCLFRNYNRQIPQKLSSLPRLISFKNSQTSDAFNLFFYNALRSVGYVPNEQMLVKITDISLLTTLLQYIELLYARFDANSNGILEESEARRAFPVFKPIFMDLAKPQLESGTITEADLYPLFTWVLKHGRPPEGTWEGLRFLYWKDDKPENWQISTDRSKISDILGFIAEQVSKSKAAAPVM